MVGASDAALWGVDEVTVWLQSPGVGLGEYAATFAEAGVDGELLLCISEADLRDDLAVESQDHIARILVSVGQLLATDIPPALSTIESLKRSSEHDGALAAPRSLGAAVTIQAAARGWRSRRHTAAMRTPSRWLVCGGEHERRYFFNEMTLVSTYTPPIVLEPYLESADGLSKLRRAANEPTAQVPPPGMLAPGQRPRWAQADNGFAGVDRPRPCLEPHRAPRAHVNPLCDHVVEAAPEEAVTLPRPRWQPHELPQFTVLRGVAAAAQPAIDASAEILAKKVLPSLADALVPAAYSTHALGDKRKPSAHVPLANLAAALADPPPVHEQLQALRDLSQPIPDDPVSVLYDQIRPALRAALLHPAATASEADGGGIPAVTCELNGWVTGRGSSTAGSAAVTGGLRDDHPSRSVSAARRTKRVQLPEPEPEPEPHGGVRSVEEIIAEMSIFEDVNKSIRTAILKYLQPTRFKSGELIFREGAPGDEFYIVRSGEVRAVKARGSVNEILLKTYHSGEYFGELALLADAPRAASCVASTPGGGEADLLKLSKADLDRSLGPFKDQIKAQMRSRASVYTSSGAFCAHKCSPIFFRFALSTFPLRFPSSIK